MQCYRTSSADKCPRLASSNTSRIPGQRLCSWRGMRPPHAQRPVARHAGDPQDNFRSDKDELGAQGSLESNAETTYPLPANASQEPESDMASTKDLVMAALAGMAMEARDGLQSPSWRNNGAYIPEPSDPKGWYECHLFDALQSAYIDSQTASHFFSELAIVDSVGDELCIDDLLHVARIADITGFNLPPVIAAQLQRLVHSAGPSAAESTAGQLLSAFSNDLPALLDTLHAVAIVPSLAWTDTALRAWLASNSTAAGSSAGAQLSAANVREIVILLEAIYIPNASSDEPTGAAEPRPPPVPYTAVVPQQVYNGTWRSTSSPRTPYTATTDAMQGGNAGGTPGGSGSGGGLSGESSAAASVRIWLDACLAALLDGGALALAHQREDMYGMLPHLATAPSAAMVERLYGEAWPPYIGSDGAASPEQIATMLWLVAASGAKLPPAIIQTELRSLEAAVLRVASADAGGGGGGGDGGRADGRSPNTPAAGNNAAGAAAAAALKAAFALPSATGNGDLAPTTPPPSPAGSPPPPHLNALFPPSPFLPPAIPPSSATPRSYDAAAAAGGRLSPYAAYLALWAFQHYNYRPHPTPARVLAPALLAAAVGRAGGGLGKRVLYIGGGGPAASAAAAGGLKPAQRCRVLRAMLTCFGAVPPHLLARYDFSPLFLGWETLGAAELMPLLNDLGALARQRRRDGDTAASGGAGGGGGLEYFVRLSHLAAHVVQLPGWPHRLVDVGLTPAVSSLSSLLAVLGTDEDSEGDGAAGAAGATAAAQPGGGSDADGVFSAVGSVNGGGGGGGVSERGLKAIRESQFAQDVLSSWLAVVLPVIQEGVKQMTGDWGTAGRRLGTTGGLQHREQQPQHQSRSAQVADATVARFVDAVRPWSSVAVAASAADAADAAVRSPTPSWRASQVPAAEAAAVPPAPPPLTAADLMAALTVLRDAAAALDPRVRPELNRTIMWAMQRLGSRAGKCAVEPEVFAAVPEMLVRLDALGWVDMPLEWVQSVIQHPDTEALWFRRLAWPEALRAVLVSGHLVQRARAEVLRRHGAAVAAAAATTAATTTDAEYPQGQRTPLSGGASHSSHSSSLEPGWLGGRDAAPTAASAAVTGPSRVSSKAAALLAAAERLRNHFLNLLTVRAAASSGPQLRQLALTWQVYGMPYDREAMASVLGALSGAAAAAAAAGDSGVASATHGSVRDAVERLQMMCEAEQVPRAEVEGLFAPLRVYGNGNRWTETDERSDGRSHGKV